MNTNETGRHPLGASTPNSLIAITQDRRAWYVSRSREECERHGSRCPYKLTYATSQERLDHPQVTRTGYVGPLTSEAGAQREADAWEATGWIAEVLPSSPAVRETVKIWQRAADARLGRSGMRRSY